MIELSQTEAIFLPADVPGADEWIVLKESEGLYLKAAYSPADGVTHVRMGNPKVDKLIAKHRAHLREQTVERLAKRAEKLGLWTRIMLTLRRGFPAAKWNASSESEI